MANFAHSSSGPVPLRTLTLGVLIVSGGTLAALPFRRYQAIPDASNSPVHVTGPTNSALRMGQVDALTHDTFHPPQITDALLPGSILASHSTADETTPPEAHAQPPADQASTLPSRKRRPDVPLTYEDLVLNIEIPEVVQDRFNATAAVQSIQKEKERLANQRPPRMETMVENQSPSVTGDAAFASSPTVGETRILQPGSRPASDLQAGITQPNRVVRETAAGSLASALTPTVDSTKEQQGASVTLPVLDGQNQLPSHVSQPRQRHWIRQPK